MADESQSLLNLWDRVKKELQGTIAEITYNTHITQFVPINVHSNKIVLQTPSKLFADAICESQTLVEKVKEALKKSNTGLTDFEIILQGEEDIYFSTNSQDEEFDSIPIEKKYTFSSFVVGPNTEFVYAAARSVAENTANASINDDINPLYIYGGSGLGKTHLMHAIANYVTEKQPHAKVLYTTCEKFINELIDSIAIRGNNRAETSKFRNFYRNVDLLLIDDIQFLANKKAVQEELFHTFNSLHQAGKQIVLTSDVSPEEMSTLESRLRTRFSGGVIIDIQPPEIETKIAILSRKAQERKMIIPNDVLEFLANNSGPDIRTLEGRLKKVIFASQLHDAEITVQFAASALHEAVREEHEQEDVTADSILDSVCNFYKVTKEQILSKGKKKELVHPRQVCAYLMCDILNIPLISIGKAMGGRDHTTIMHARDKIEGQIKLNPTLAKEVGDIKNMILKQ